MTKLIQNQKVQRRAQRQQILFNVQKYCKKLDKDRSEQFHSILAQMLFTTKCARTDIGTSVSFLTTIVKELEQDDWLKLAHLMIYIRGTIDLLLTLSSNGTGMLKWFVDGSYGVHPNMRGNSGGGLSRGTGLPILSSIKQKLNTRSSTESHIVGFNYLIPSILWARKFLNTQDYDVT